MNNESDQIALSPKNWWREKKTSINPAPPCTPNESLKITFQNFPEGEITHEDGERYVPVFAEEYVAIQEILSSSDNAREKIKNMFEAAENKIILDGKDDTRTPRLELLIFYLKSFVGLTSVDDLKLDDTLRVNNWKFVQDAMLAVVPLFMITVYNMLTKQPFAWWKCSTVAEDSFDWAPSSFTEDCSYVPVNLYIDDYPHRPGISSSEDDDTTCHGIASNIANSSYTDWALITQYVIYAALLSFAVHLVEREKVEKRYLRVALYLQGVFLPVDDQSRVITPFRKKYPYLVAFLPYFDKSFAFVLGVLYLLSLTVYTPARQEWYVFPSSEEQEDFMDKYNEFTNWCDALTAPVFLTYSQPPNGVQFSVLAEVVLFFTGVYALSDSQSTIYDWIDTDNYMNMQRRDSCCYFNVHANRSRIFNELMVIDWLVARVEGPTLKSIINDDAYQKIREDLKEENVEKLKKILISIEEKMP